MYGWSPAPEVHWLSQIRGRNLRAFPSDLDFVELRFKAFDLDHHCSAGRYCETSSAWPRHRAQTHAQVGVRVPGI